MKYQIFSTYTRRGQTHFCLSNFSIKGHFFLSPKICMTLQAAQLICKEMWSGWKWVWRTQSLNQILKNQQLTSCHGNQIELQNYVIFLFLRCFIFVQVSEQKLWFGRDYFGRRSLLWHLPSNPDDVLAIASVTERNPVAAGTDLVSIFFCFFKVKCTCRTKADFFRV